MKPAQEFDQTEYAADVITFGLDTDPYAWVLYAFPWGVAGSELEIEDGPDQWQTEVLCHVRDELVKGRTFHGVIQEAIQVAVASGHGVGKSALVAWLTLWALSTFVDTKGIVTANTATQLATKTWPELIKWHRLCICQAMFCVTATSIFSVDPAREKTWRIDAIPWTETNPEAFAGLHNIRKRILLIFDEGSAISDGIWEVAEGALTDKDTEILWFVFGNPTRNVGRFRECWRKFARFWKTWQIDSRNVKHANKNQLDKWAEAYGEDSDFFRIRVKGQFPNASEKQFIPTDLLDKAKGRHVKEHEYNFAPTIITCDPAWWGGDEIDIYLRQGLKATLLKTLAKNDNDIFVAGLLAGYEDEYKADAVFIDQGYGQGIYSAGKSMNREWTLISFGSASARPDCANKRVEMYYLLREWLKEGGCFPDDSMIYEELLAMEYDINLKGQFILEEKDDIKKKIGRSPNRADALALTFAMPVQKKDQAVVRISNGLAEFTNGRHGTTTADKFDIFGL